MVLWTLQRPIATSVTSKSVIRNGMNVSDLPWLLVRFQDTSSEQALSSKCLLIADVSLLSSSCCCSM